ncbi:DEAD/DEAH box helicase [Mammaliicoccus vitulinus]|uniref:DEAD/DEAH box helicase n=1 Tax=Mammaliicoccus vitulinus TaxID=71237 RepID=UPI00248C0D1A|nr:DEAD/DEAH box helicase [Mammaliicoccus vitulinus]
MNVEINSNIEIFEPNENIDNYIKNNLILNNPLYKQMIIQGKEDLIRIKHIPEKINLAYKQRNKVILPFGCLHSIWHLIKNCPIETKFNENGNISIKDEPSNLDTTGDYNYQENAINAMIKARGGVLVSPCGSGKTCMGIEIIKRIGKKALWLCHTSDLLKQAQKDMLNLYPNMKIGLTTNGTLDIGEDVTISTIQTLVTIDPALYKDQFDVIILDECAHVSGCVTQMKMFIKVLSQIPARYKFGLTATPDRSDGLIKSMYAYIGTNLLGDFAPTYTINKDDVKTMVSIHEKIEMNTGYEEDKLYELVNPSGMIIYNQLIDSLLNNDKRNNIIIDNVIKCDKEHRKQIVLSNRIEHCKLLTEKLEEKGLKVQLVTGKTTTQKNRTKILFQEIDWDIIVATYSLLKEGVNIKELDTLHLAMPIADKSMMIQCAGRIERYLPNKKQPIVYDYVDVDIPYCNKIYLKRRRALKNRF